MVFNRRRPGELERITMMDFANFQSAHTISALGGDFKENLEEALLANRYKRFEIRGKLNRTVPVLVDFEIETYINLIIKNRKKIGISSKNPYIFARPSDDHRHKYLRACFLLRSYANNCGATRPELLRATFLRKHIATECALNDLADNVIHDVANFMGYAIDIHINIYSRPIEKRDILQMSKILEMIQGENISQDDGQLTQKSNSSTIIEPLENLENKENASCFKSDRIQKRNTSTTAMGCLESLELYNKNALHSQYDESVPGFYTFIDDDSSSSDGGYCTKKKGKHISGLQRVCGPKRSWTPQEKMAACEYFGKYLLANKLPSMAKICQKLPLINELKQRSPTSVKTWLHNELVRKHDGVKRKCWTSKMKNELNRVFADHLKDSTLPSNAECSIARDNSLDFQKLSIAAIKTAVANELHRKINS